MVMQKSHANVTKNKTMKENMKKHQILILISILIISTIIFILYSSTNSQNNKVIIKETKEHKLIGTIQYKSTPIFHNDSLHQVIIKVYYKKPVTKIDDKTVFFKGVSSGEYLEIIIKGEITNFKVSEIKFNNNLTFDIIKNIKEFPSLKNQTIFIETYLPEGIPSEKLTWIDINGKIQTWLIGQNN